MQGMKKGVAHLQPSSYSEQFHLFCSTPPK